MPRRLSEFGGRRYAFSDGLDWVPLLLPVRMLDEPPAVSLLSRKYFRGLDGLRGVAIGLVMMHHFAREAQGYAGPVRLLQVFNAGWAGVDLFFVLSGFLITGILLDAKERGVPLRIFYARRALRIFPLYYFALCLVCFGPLVLAAFGCATTPVSNTFWLWSYLSNLPKTFGGLNEPRSQLLNVGHFWTLAIEEQFYLLWPWLVVGLSERRFQIAALFCLPLTLCVKALLLKLGVPAIRTDFFTLVRMDGLCIGALLACLIRQVNAVQALRRQSATVGVAIAVGAFPLSMLKHQLPYLTKLTNHLVLSLFFGAVTALVVSSADGAWINRFLGWGPLVWLGRRSYGLYVWHYLLLGAMIQVLRGSGMLSPGYIGELEIVLGLLVLSCGVAAVSWAVLEQPILRLKRHFEYSKVESQASVRPRTT